MLIPSSELIINPDNSVYHLKLRADEIADTIITVGDPERVSLVAQHLDKIHVERYSREFRTITGELGGKPITIISTGIGTDNIDIVLNELDALANIDFASRKVKESHRQLSFVRIGTSGAIRADLALDSFVISSHAIGFDGLLNFYDAAHIRNSTIEAQIHASQNFYAVDGDETMIAAFQDLGKQGITITANGFYGPQSRNLRLKHNFDFEAVTRKVLYKGLTATNLEMETAGIYGLAQLLGHRAISLNAILANRVTGHFSSNPSATVNRLIEKSLAVISRL